MPSYNPREIEPRWQRFWEENRTFRTPDLSDKPKLYILDMFPYPSAAGLHVGHPEGYTATDILARYRRMCGWNVLHPMGWDAFGLPAEQHAIKTGEHPRSNTENNIANFRRQIKMLGFSYDWDREVNTTDPNYFRWTQWIFLVLFDTWYDREQQRGRPIAELPIPADVQTQGEKAVHAYRDSKRLAYLSKVPVNWCEALGTVLANEEVKEGVSEVGGHPVVRMPLEQWLLRITDYADRLLNDLDIVDWPESIKIMQRDWIGRSEGAEVDFALASDERETIRVFTTRPDTLFGATYMVLAPEHPLVDAITTKGQQSAITQYREAAARKSERERMDAGKEKTGVFTGAYAINPVNGEKIPIWIADYVLWGYGTGAIMAVPAHDLRDWEFAKAFDLPIRQVVEPPAGYTPSREEAALADDSGYPFAGEGTAINSGEFTGLSTAEFKQRITERLQEQGKGSRTINYKLRDWLFSRQRYWGEPFPILHEVDEQGRRTGVKVAVRDEELPVRLPDLADFKPTGKLEPPLGKATDWVNVEREGKRYQRETNTMPQWAGSCWYYLRYIDPKNTTSFCDPDKAKYWLPVDLYVGGAEHAVLHLLYSRFWHKVLYDRGHVPTPEPFQRLVNQGLILGEVEYTGFKQDGKWVSAQEVEFNAAGRTAYVKKAKAVCEIESVGEEAVEKRGDSFVLKDDPCIRVDARAFKMSKSRGNVVNPDDVVKQYGADSLRLYEMFMGPLEATKPWSTRGVEGVYRFLSRVWRLFIDDRAEQVMLNETVKDVTPDKDTLRKLHQTIQKITEDLEGMRFNTAIAAMMELTNHLTPLEVRPRSVLKTFVVLLAPFAPHLAEELWHALGERESLAYATWPTFDPELIKVNEIEVPVQIKGKVKAKLTVPADISDEDLQQAALGDPRIAEQIAGQQVRKVIVVPRKLVNIVVG